MTTNHILDGLSFNFIFIFDDFCYLGQISYKVGQIQTLFCDMISIHDVC